MPGSIGNGVAVPVSSVLMPAVPDVRPTSVSTTGFADGLGRRTIRFDRESGTTLECLHLRPELAAFEPLLKGQAKILAQLAHERIVRVQSLESAAGRVTVVSELLDGDRLSDIIEARAGGDSAVSGMDAAFGFLLQVLPTISAMHAVSLVHGAIAPHRIVLTTNAQVVLADAIYGSTLPRLHLSQRRAWAEFGIVVSAAPGAKRLDAASDVSQAAFSALTIALGRSLDALDPAASLHELVREAVEIDRPFHTRTGTQIDGRPGHRGSSLYRTFATGRRHLSVCARGVRAI
jgi:serine/threonine protein kinase